MRSWLRLFTRCIVTAGLSLCLTPGVADEDKNDETTSLTARIDADPKDAEAYILRGKSWYRQGDLEKSLANFDMALKLGADVGTGRSLRGNVFYLKGEFAKAILDFNEVVRLTPDDEG